MKIILVFISTLKAAEPTFIQRYETLLSKGYEWLNVSQTIGNNWVQKFEDPNFSARFFVEFAEDMRTIFDETSGKNLRLFRINKFFSIIFLDLFLDGVSAAEPIFDQFLPVNGSEIEEIIKPYLEEIDYFLSLPGDLTRSGRTRRNTNKVTKKLCSRFQTVDSE